VLSRYNPLTIKFAISLKAKMGNASYEGLRRVFKIPSKRYLLSFRQSSLEDPDGMLEDVLRAMRDKAKLRGYRGWQLRGAVSFDGMKIREGLYWSINSGTIIGFAHDVFDHPDVIAAEFTRHARSAERAESPLVLPLAKEYLVFYFSSLDPKVSFRFPVARYCLSSIKPGFLVANIPAVLKGLDEFGFVAVSVTCDGAGENHKALSALADISADTFLETVVGKKLDLVDDEGEFDAVEVVSVVGDYRVQVRRVSAPAPAAAAEVPAAPAAPPAAVAVPPAAAPPPAGCDPAPLAPLPPQPTFEVDLAVQNHVWRDRPRSLLLFPEIGGHRLLDFFHHGLLPGNIDYSKKIAFAHPSRRGEVVFVNQDMPHILKRTVNCIERHTLQKRGPGGEFEPLSLKMIHEAWKCLGGGSSVFVRTEDMAALTIAHFLKECFNRMRVGLAAQVASRRAASVMTRAAAGGCAAGRQPLPLAEQRLYSSLIAFCLKMDRIVDIMNARGTEREAPILNSPQHVLIDEVLDILKWFADWRSEVEDSDLEVEEVFLGKRLWEDLNGLLLGVACTARFNLARFPLEAMLQRRLDQDPCEHHFNHVRQGGGTSHSNPTAQEATSSTAIAGTLHAASLGDRGNSSGANVSMAEAMEPLPKRVPRGR
jgi:hypothetical protein